MGVSLRARFKNPLYLPAEGAVFDVELLDVPEPPPPPPQPPPSGWADAFSLPAAVCVGGVDVREWLITAPITRLDLFPDGFHVEFMKRYGPGRWPDKIPPGWMGAIQYTLWIGALLGHVWHLAACLNIDFDNGSHRYADDATEPAKYPRDLWYLDAALGNRVPVVGDPTAFMVTAGALRGLNVVSVLERSQVVVVPFPIRSGQSYVFEGNL